MEWISVKDKLPEDGQIVLAFSDSIKIARFCKGIAQNERRKMQAGESQDPKIRMGYTSAGVASVKRSKIYMSCDEFGNNSVPYSWESPDCIYQWFGLEFQYWMPMPEPPKEQAKEAI